MTSSGKPGLIFRAVVLILEISAGLIILEQILILEIFLTCSLEEARVLVVGEAEDLVADPDDRVRAGIRADEA